MTTATDQFIDIAKRNQGAVGTAVRSWADTAQTLIGNLTEGQAKLLDAQAYVATYFDFAAKVLTSQREIAHQWVTAAQNTTEAVAEQASRATESLTTHAVNAAEAAAETPAGPSSVADRKAAASTARAFTGP
jgi:hypothetical protein